MIPQGYVNSITHSRIIALQSKTLRNLKEKYTHTAHIFTAAFWGAGEQRTDYCGFDDKSYESYCNYQVMYDELLCKESVIWHSNQVIFSIRKTIINIFKKNLFTIFIYYLTKITSQKWFPYSFLFHLN